MFNLSQPIDVDGIKLPDPWYVATDSPGSYFLVCDVHGYLRRLDRDPLTGVITVESIGNMQRIEIKNYSPHAAFQTRETFLLRRTFST